MAQFNTFNKKIKAVKKEDVPPVVKTPVIKTPSNVAKKSLFSSVYFRIGIILLVIFILFSKVLILRIQERTYYDSVESYIVQKSVVIGSDGYGSVNNINVKVGDKVNKGDILFTYVRNDIDGKVSVLKNLPPASQVSLDYFNNAFQFLVKAPTSGRIKNINIQVGTYITAEDRLMEMQTNDFVAYSKFFIPADQIGNIYAGARTEVRVPGNKVHNGTVRSVYPYYDRKTQILTLDSTVEGGQNLLEGVPVVTRVYIKDDFADGVINAVKGISIGFIRDFLL